MRRTSPRGSGCRLFGRLRNLRRLPGDCAPFAVALLETVEIARRSEIAQTLAVGRHVGRTGTEALQHQDVGLDERAVPGGELDQHVGVEVHRVVLMRVQLLDVREEGVRRPLEEAVVVDGVVVVVRARRRPVLPVDRAREALQRVLDRGPVDDLGPALLDPRDHLLTEDLVEAPHELLRPLRVLETFGQRLDASDRVQDRLDDQTAMSACAPAGERLSQIARANDPLLDAGQDERPGATIGVQ